MNKSLLHTFISKLESENELVRIQDFCSPNLEISEITDRISKTEKGGKALLFENNGTAFPLLINMYGSDKRMLMSLGLKSYDEWNEKLNDIFDNLTNPPKSLFEKIGLLKKLNKLSAVFPKRINSKAPCQEVIINNPDLGILPVLKCWPFDGGKFITLPMVHTKDPITGLLNVGMYRVQVLNSNSAAMHWHIHKTGARHYEGYKKINKNIPVAITLGGNPLYAYCASAPLPEQISEYLLAGFLMNKPVKLVKCISQDIEVPYDVDIVIEGFIDPNEDLVLEGPFGDHTGFYSLADYYPKVHVTCISHRIDAVYPATIVGIPPQEDFYLIKATEKLFLTPIKKAMLPEIVDMHMPACGVAHNLTIVKIHNQYPGHAYKIMHALWGAGQMMLNKVLVVTNVDIDLDNYESLIKAIFYNIDLKADIYLTYGTTDVLDHSSDKFVLSGKLGIDATIKEIKQRPLLLNNELIELLKSKGLININLLNENIPVVFIKKSAVIDDSIVDNKVLVINDIISEGSGIVIIIDNNVDINDYETVLWLMFSNIDPKRDVEKKNLGLDDVLWIIDGTAKPKNSDGRVWPSVIAMTDDIIDTIDNKWDKLPFKDFIESPSNKYKSLTDRKSAINNCLD